MSSSEFSEWMAFYSLEPFGEERDDLRAGSIASPLLNVWIPKGKRQSKASDWIMKFGEEEKTPQSLKQMDKMLRGLAAAHKPPKKKKDK